MRAKLCVCVGGCVVIYLFLFRFESVNVAFEFFHAHERFHVVDAEEEKWTNHENENEKTVLQKSHNLRLLFVSYVKSLEMLTPSPFNSIIRTCKQG